MNFRLPTLLLGIVSSERSIIAASLALNVQVILGIDRYMATRHLVQRTLGSCGSEQDTIIQEALITKLLVYEQRADEDLFSQDLMAMSMQHSSHGAIQLDWGDSDRLEVPADFPSDLNAFLQDILDDCSVKANFALWEDCIHKRRGPLQSFVIDRVISIYSSFQGSSLKLAPSARAFLSLRLRGFTSVEERLQDIMDFAEEHVFGEFELGSTARNAWCAYAMLNALRVATLLRPRYMKDVCLAISQYVARCYVLCACVEATLQVREMVRFPNGAVGDFQDPNGHHRLFRTVALLTTPQRHNHSFSPQKVWLYHTAEGTKHLPPSTLSLLMGADAYAEGMDESHRYLHSFVPNLAGNYT